MKAARSGSMRRYEYRKKLKTSPLREVISSEKIHGMVNSLVAILLGVLLVEMARFGGHVSANPASSTRIAKRYTWQFRLYAILAIALTITQGVRTYLASKEFDRAQASLRNSIKGLDSDVQKSDTGRQVDDAYFKAKLEDAYRVNDQLLGLGPALMKMARISEEYSKRQYETRALSDKKLLETTSNVVAQIRNLGEKCKAKEESIFNPSDTQRLQLQGMTQDQLIQLGREINQKRQQAYMTNQQNCQMTYRNNLLGEASYVRRELMSRLGGDDFLLPSEKIKDIAIDGVFAGVDPIDGSADYLEALANKLRQQQAPKPQ